MNTLYTNGAIIYCEGSFNTSMGRPTHELLKYSKRYRLRCIIDSIYAGNDAGKILNGKKINIPIVKNIEEAFNYIHSKSLEVNSFVIGMMAKDMNVNKDMKENIMKAIKNGLNVDSGLYDYLTEDREIRNLAIENDVELNDISKPSLINNNRLDVQIEDVNSVIISVLGTDSEVGKRSAAQKLVKSLSDDGFKVAFIGTGQISWMQGAKYNIILDSIISRNIPSEIENLIYRAWIQDRPHYIIIEGQRSLLNPKYPGGLEIITAAHPDIIILQHSPKRKYYRDAPEKLIHSLQRQIKVIETLSCKTVSAITLEREDIDDAEVENYRRQMNVESDIPVYDMDNRGVAKLAKYIVNISGRVNPKKIKFKKRLVVA